ncbi:MAG TPA: toll/interleukin-1 receptor domain-containing protein [Vicinamibacterales bacterium]|jgi:hypothetical protein|nr:toll/interleukin-1 receptor domain-containing protein [Vicinamibacterales bacterium]
MAGTFISYRREDAAGYAGRLRESLERRLGTARVFRDVDTLRPGQDFVQAIEARLADCAVMLAVIGREWTGARDLAGSRRLDEPFDFVRLEIAAALARPNVLVVPVLVEGASMPATSELPDNLKPLARRHAVSVRDETWDADVDRLANVVETAMGARDPSRADAPISAAQLWAAAALAVVIVGLLVFNGRRPRPSSEDAASAGASGASPTGVEAPAAGSTSGGGAPISTAGGSPYTIDIPRIAEAAFGDVVYAVASGNVVMRGDGPELRLRIRIMNTGRYDVNFWDDSFRLAVGGDVLSPTSGLNLLAPGNSLRYGIITFRLRPQMRSGVFRIVSNQETAEIPLDLSPTGRPPVDEQAEIADSMGQAIQAAVVREPVTLHNAGDVSATLLQASTRRFANTLRFTLSLRMSNRGRYDAHSSQIMMRVEAGGEQRPPFLFPNETIAAAATATGTAAFDLPPTTTRAVVRTTIGDQTTEKSFDLK